MACRALEVIRNRPMAFVPELRADQVGDQWRDPAQLCMAEGVSSTRTPRETLRPVP